MKARPNFARMLDRNVTDLFLVLNRCRYTIFEVTMNSVRKPRTDVGCPN